MRAIMIRIGRSSPVHSCLLLVCLLSIVPFSDAATLCTVCLNGQDEVYVNQSKTFSVKGLPVQKCGDLLSTVGLFTPESQICQSIQSVSTYCGCPRKERACTLCENATVRPLHPLLQLSSYNASDYVFGAPEGVKLNCETLDSVLNILANDTDNLCLETRSDVARTCGCPRLASNANTTNTTNTSNNKTSSSNKPKEYVPPCSLCLDAKSSPLFPNRTIRIGTLPINNCHDLTVFANLLAATDLQCLGLQSLGPFCGCQIPPGACSFCPNGEAVPDPDKFAPILHDFKGLPQGLVSDLAANLTCGEFESIVAIPPPSSIGIGIDPALLCLVSQLRSGMCGCSQGWKAKLITWFYRVSAILSLFGSSFILWDIIQKPSESRTTYHQLVFGMTCFDIVTAMAYALTGVLLPPYSGQYQAHGNRATCLLQGFMIQLGETSVFYNLLLSFYFLLLIKYNWKERRFRQYRNYFHLPIIAIGGALAGGCLPFVVPQLGFCYIAIPPEYPNRIPISMFFAIPTSLALLFMIICSFVMCYHVYVTERTTVRFSIMKRNLALTKKVCWQSLFYCSIFILTLPILMVNYYVNFQGENAFWQFLVSALLAPSQGFLNSLIYFQRAHSFQWILLMFPCWRSIQEPGPTPAGRPPHGPSHETGETIDPSQEDMRHSDVRLPSSTSEDVQFSAPAAHWMNEELAKQRRRRSSMAEASGKWAISVRTLFRKTDSVRRMVDDNPDQEVSEDRDGPRGRNETRSASERSISRSASVWNVFRKSNSVPAAINNNSRNVPSPLDSAPAEAEIVE